MRINSINVNQNFGRLKITATKEGEKYRKLYSGKEFAEQLEELDSLSGKIPLVINFDAFVDKTSKTDSLPFLTCNIGCRKIFMYKGIQSKDDFNTQINYIKRQVLKEKKYTDK